MTMEPLLHDLEARLARFREVPPPERPWRSLSSGQLCAEDRRRHFAAVLFADYACYPSPPDRVRPDELQAAMDAFPQGFRSWWLDYPESGWSPVGYTGWYPIPPSEFEKLERGGASMTDRTVKPIGGAPPANPFLYLFNFSVLAPLRGGPGARQVMQTLISEFEPLEPRGLSAITVSDDGARVVKRFGMRCTGRLPSEQGPGDRIYVVRR